MYRHAVQFARRPLHVASIVAALLLTGCAVTGGQSPPESGGFLDKLLGAPAVSAGPAPAPEPAYEDCGTAAQCRSMLKTMIDNRDRSWVGQHQPPAAYANGTRLFAYRALRKKLNCRELGLALEEVGAAAKAYGGAVPGVTPDQASRTRALSAQVEGELAKERAGRCRA